MYFDEEQKKEIMEEANIMRQEEESWQKRLDMIEQMVTNFRPYLHICEVCGAQQYLFAREAYRLGPHEYGQFGVLLPRTCPNCGISDTIWWKMEIENKTIDDLTDEEKQIVARIKAEPYNLL